MNSCLSLQHFLRFKGTFLANMTILFFQTASTWRVKLIR